MKVLAIDTSSNICSTAIVEDGKVICEMHNESEKEHSQTLMPMIKKMMDSNETKLEDIDLLACGVGPGSFTGIRIGIATIKAFSDAKNIPMVGIESLEALAYSALIKKGKKDCKILSMIDARNENVYFAVYRFYKGVLSIYKNPEVRNITDTLNYIDLLKPLYIVGDTNQSKIEPLIKAISSKEHAEGKETFKHEYIREDLPTMAEAIGIAANEKYKLGTITDSSSVSPMYLRKPQAERQLEGQEIEKNENDELSLMEMTANDLERLKENYDEFPNIWDIKTLEEDFKASKYVIAKKNDEILGYIGYKVVLDELEIMNIVTKKNKRKRGIASNLLSYIIRKNKVEKINLEVDEKNTTAVNLYKKFGFREVGLRKNYYNGIDSAILMSM